MASIISFHWKILIPVLRAPLSLSFTPFWLKSNKDFVKVFENWMDQTLARYNDVYFVTNYQALLWMTNPVSNGNIGTFEEWKDKCTVLSRRQIYFTSNEIFFEKKN